MTPEELELQELRVESARNTRRVIDCRKTDLAFLKHGHTQLTIRSISGPLAAALQVVIVEEIERLSQTLGEI